MKIFIYKILISFLLIFILFHITFGYAIRNLESKFYNNFSNDKILFLKDKVRKEIIRSLNKDKILNNEDAELLKKFINKITNEIKNN
ncbi:cell wall metabolism sensor histidine kinase WalK [Pelagibacteraceae bacterium]|jgi:hypothetical protein|nr:cell wall metabolism sensor histidine kinase WalK [Pelagibacteraceae bacterium]|tara:strand:- start:159 stop:419 length:261 start_codon:yes stop_codon:yes gene_type:complete